MESHRANPSCAGCHRTMDGLGFTLENFNAVGAWRTRDAGDEVNAEGAMADGQRAVGVAGLRAALLKHPDVFVGTLTEKLMTYALGRGLQHYDMPVVRGIVARRRAAGQPVLGAGDGHREERAVPDAAQVGRRAVPAESRRSDAGKSARGVVMFVTKRSLSRRTVLKGMGTTLALPFLESMVPAFQALAQSPAQPPLRFGAVYFPNGAPMASPNNYWMPTAAGRARNHARSSSRSRPSSNR